MRNRPLLAAVFAAAITVLVTTPLLAAQQTEQKPPPPSGMLKGLSIEAIRRAGIRTLADALRLATGVSVGRDLHPPRRWFARLTWRSR